jgi:virulence-associated protein VagC
MTGIKRKVIRVGTSKAITLPPDWVLDEEEVILIKNRDYLLVAKIEKEDELHRVAKKNIEQLSGIKIID